MAQKLKQSDLANLPAPAKSNRIYYDSEAPGLGFRITANGKRSFIVRYLDKYRQERRYTFGHFPNWNLSAARVEARSLMQAVNRGEDPLEERKKNREAETVADLCERYIEEHLPTKRPNSAKEDRGMIVARILPELGREKVCAVTYQDIDRLHKKITREGKPYRANRVLSLLNKMFALSVLWKMRSDNPCQGVVRNYEEPRERYLERDELERIARALGEYEDRESAHAIMLALLTGARRAEVLRSTWNQFNLEEGIWTKPSAHTKIKRAHRVPLSAHAIELLTAMQATAKPNATHLFPNRIKKDERVDIRKPWLEICAAAGLEGIRFHDLRHSYASLLVNSGLSLPVIGQLLGHTQAQTTQRYAHLFDDTLRDATDRVGQMVPR